MTKKIKLSDCRPFDIAEYLDEGVSDILCKRGFSC